MEVNLAMNLEDAKRTASRAASGIQAAAAGATSRSCVEGQLQGSLERGDGPLTGPSSTL